MDAASIPLPIELQQLVADASHHLAAEMRRKGEVGAEKYGEWAFLQNPTTEMALDEIVDLMNYLKYTYTKIFIMNHILKQLNEQRTPTKEGFISTADLFGHRESQYGLQLQAQ